MGFQGPQGPPGNDGIPGRNVRNYSIQLLVGISIFSLSPKK